jgi:hypothetical protein
VQVLPTRSLHGTVDIFPDDVAFNPTPFRDLIINAYGTVRLHAAHDPSVDKSIFNFRRIIANTPSRYNLIFVDPHIQVNVKDVRLAEYGNAAPTRGSTGNNHVRGRF